MSSMTNVFGAVLFFQVVIQGFQGVYSVSWEEWWTYDGISGPSFWGLINPDWSLCNQGRRQSPVDIEPKRLLYDPLLEDLRITDVKVDGHLLNSGHGIVFKLPDPTSNLMVNISGGPLAYSYPIHSVSFHFGLDDQTGSEHSLDGNRFVGEIQLLGFNADLYENFSLAAEEPNGVVALAILLEVGDLSNQALRKVTNELADIQYGGQSVHLTEVSLLGFLPEGAREFITYEGSRTEPGCQETVTWIIMNRPVYITMKQLLSLRKLMQGEQKDPRAPLGGNFRPIQPLNGRNMRTNVRIASNQDDKCPNLVNNLEYKAKTRVVSEGMQSGSSRI